MCASNDVSCQAILLSAPASGQGKTTITAAIARLLRRNGKDVRVFKFGPDYLDPQILGLASGEPVIQLDLWMAGEEWCREQLYNAAAAMDSSSSNGGGGGGGGGVILVEGAMGLFDGTPSSADLAAKFGIPVVLIMDVRAMAQTAAAIAVGLKTYRNDFDMIGMIANKCGSTYHGRLVKEALPEDLPMWAALKREGSVELPERHLGLVQPSEDGHQGGLMEERVEAGADLLEASGIFAFISQSKHVSFQSQHIEPPPSTALEGVTIAIAKDSAFSFTYAANISLLQDMGASILYFSPIHDTTIPLEANALWLPGGYPELHAKALSQNTQMLASLHQFHKNNYPILAECGGFLYCMETLVDRHGKEYPMSSLMPGRGAMKQKAG